MTDAGVCGASARLPVQVQVPKLTFIIRLNP
jgi:hypothetical protein